MLFTLAEAKKNKMGLQVTRKPYPKRCEFGGTTGQAFFSKLVAYALLDHSMESY